jgi:hypothetical protein
MKKLFYIFIFAFASKVSSQNYVDILKLSYATTPPNAFDTSSSKTTLDQIDADLTVPIKLNERSAIITGFMYENFQTKLFADRGSVNFGSSVLKMGFNRQFSEKWSGTFMALPKLASDYKNIGSKDVQVGGAVIMKCKKHDRLNYKFGLYYNSELFGPFFVPMVGMYYLSPNEKFETNIMFPLQADATYKLTPFLNVGTNFNGQIRSYHLTDVTPVDHSTYVARSTNEFYAYLKFNFTKSISLQTKVGQSVGRSYKVYDENDRVDFGLPATFIGHKRHQLNSNFSNGLIFQATFIYRFNLNKK